MLIYKIHEMGIVSRKRIAWRQIQQAEFKDSRLPDNWPQGVYEQSGMRGRCSTYVNGMRLFHKQFVWSDDLADGAVTTMPSVRRRMSESAIQ